MTSIENTRSTDPADISVPDRPAPDKEKGFAVSLDKAKAAPTRSESELRAAKTNAADLAAPLAQARGVSRQTVDEHRIIDTAKPLEAAAAATKGYDQALKDRKFGLYDGSNKSWTNGSSLEKFQDPKGPAMRQMVGSQGSWLSAKNSGPLKSTNFEVPDAHSNRVFDYTQANTPVKTEVKVGTSFNPAQLDDYAKGPNRVHYDLLQSPLTDKFEARQNSNAARIQQASDATQGRISVAQQPFGPSKTSVRTLQAIGKSHAVMKGVSRVAVPVGIGIDAYRLSNAYKADGGRIGHQTGETMADVAGSWSGALAGGAAGVKAGAVVGTAIGGPIGTAVGAAVGGLAGAVGGAIVVSSMGKTVYRWLSRSW